MKMFIVQLEDLIVMIGISYIKC